MLINYSKISCSNQTCNATFQAYLSGLGKKNSRLYKSRQATIDWDKFEDLSDKTLSDSSDASEKRETKPEQPPTNRFLKKKSSAVDDGNAVKGKKPGENFPSLRTSQMSCFIDVFLGTASAPSGALARATKLAAEPKPKKELIRILSDSDMDISLSTDTNLHDYVIGDALALVPGCFCFLF